MQKAAGSLKLVAACAAQRPAGITFFEISTI